MKLSPRYSRLAVKSYHGVVASIGLEDILSSGFSGSPDEARLIVFCLDNHKANRAALRHLVVLLKSKPNIFICTVVCFAHILSNSAKWGLTIFPVGDVRL